MSSDCDYCWGTGYYHGYGAPCPHGHVAGQQAESEPGIERSESMPGCISPGSVVNVRVLPDDSMEKLIEGAMKGLLSPKSLEISDRLECWAKLQIANDVYYVPFYTAPTA